MKRLNSLDDTINKNQMLFGINQGGIYDDLRVNHMKEIAELNLDGYAIGGLAVGEPAETMYHIIEEVEPFAPKDKIRYLMGVGTPVNILESVARGVDLLTVLCRAETQDTVSSSLGTECVTSIMQNMKQTNPRLTSIVTALFAETFQGHT